MKVTPDGQTLVVRGYIGIELLGRESILDAVADSAYSMLDPSINPNPAVNPKRGRHAVAPAGCRPPQNSRARRR